MPRPVTIQILPYTSAMFSALFIACCPCAAVGDEIVIDRTGMEITDSATVRITTDHLPASMDEPALRISGDDLVIDFAGSHLRGATDDALPNTFSGVGLHITGHNITVRNLSVSGYKGGIYAIDCDGLVLEDIDVSGNFAQRLGSTPQREDSSDWLWPHNNDGQQWLHNYGAGVYVRNASEVTIRRVLARRMQNGIIIDRVNDSRIYDNDCSFLSGWGLAMWRSNRNVITRNAFDFCIRGYSHGVYNRGQDSAGILMFEQCSDNVIAENSATHGGDGFFGFAGREALGQVPPRDPSIDFENEQQRYLWHYQRGNNNNLLIANDFSYAAAHGIEMTFSFNNRFIDNRLVGNAICGIWAGYSQNTQIFFNTIELNGDMGYGQERGGINIDNGRSNHIQQNSFRDNRCGVFLWSSTNPGLQNTPWGRANNPTSINNIIFANTFTGPHVAIQMRRTKQTWMGNNFVEDSDDPFDMDEETELDFMRYRGPLLAEFEKPEYPVYGESRPVGARKEFAGIDGRQHIIVTEWGPYDWKSPLMHLHVVEPARHTYRLLGRDTLQDVVHIEGAQASLQPWKEEIAAVVWVDVENEAVGIIAPYTLTVHTEGGEELTVRGQISRTTWRVNAFAYETDPRDDVEAWRAEAEAGVEFTVPHLQLIYVHGGPSQLPDVPTRVRNADLPRDYFGTIARTSIEVPAGRWKVRTVSDDGIRVWLDDELVIDDWTWHAPKEHTYEFTLEEPRTIDLRVEHFELDGYAILTLDIEAVK